MHRSLPPVLALVGLGLAAAPAAAHITLVDPPPRTDLQKDGPCGAGPSDGRGDIITVYQGGQTITVKWIETVDHPGHYRISFDPDGQDDFGDPASFEELYSNPAVMIDGILDESGQDVMYQQDITLPEMSCDTCTLQLVQVMTDKAPYGDGNDLYYQCADIVIEGVAAGSTGDTGGGTSDATTGDAGGSTTGAGTDGGTTADPGATSHASHASHGGDPTTGADATASDGSSGDAPDAGAEGGCGCRSDAPGGWGLLALVPALALRRRRPRR